MWNIFKNTLPRWVKESQISIATEWIGNHWNCTTHLNMKPSSLLEWVAQMRIRLESVAQIWMRWIILESDQNEMGQIRMRAEWEGSDQNEMHQIRMKAEWEGSDQNEMDQTRMRWTQTRVRWITLKWGGSDLKQVLRLEWGKNQIRIFHQQNRSLHHSYFQLHCYIMQHAKCNITQAIKMHQIKTQRTCSYSRDW